MYFICTKNTYVLFRYDGTEIHEASACLAALTRGGAEPICYAPDADQAHVINHQKGEEMETGTYYNNIFYCILGPSHLCLKSSF